jgi:Ca-activated chloride channel homolog
MVTHQGQPVVGLAASDFEVLDNSAVSLGSGLTSDLTAVRTALERAVPEGETSLVDGTYAAIIVGESDAGRALIIAFSDGLDTSSWLSPEAVLDAARRSDVVVYGVSVGQTRPEFLNEIAALTGGRVFDVEKTVNLPTTFSGILQEFRHRYLISYTPRGVAKGGWHQLTVRVKRPGTVKARPGYLGS